MYDTRNEEWKERVFIIVHNLIQNWIKKKKIDSIPAKSPTNTHWHSPLRETQVVDVGGVGQGVRQLQEHQPLGHGDHTLHGAVALKGPHDPYAFKRPLVWPSHYVKWRPGQGTAQKILNNLRQRVNSHGRLQSLLTATI